MSLERTIRDTVIAESHDLDGRLQQLVRAGLMPANTIPILRKAIVKVQGGMTLQGAERDVMANFINSMMFIVLGDDAIFNRARAGAKTYATEAKEKTEYDYEGDMAMGQLKSIIANSQRMHDMLSDDTNLPEWVQSKITLAEDYISTASNYMQGEMSEETVNEYAALAGVAGRMIASKLAKNAGAGVATRAMAGAAGSAAASSAVKKFSSTKETNEETIEEKRGLWDNIHAKRKRIKAGSGERMRKPGSEGAPSAADLKNSRTEEVEQVTEATYFVHTGINAHHVNKKIPTGKKDAGGQALMTSKVIKSFPYGDTQSKQTSPDQHKAAHAYAKKLNAGMKEEVEQVDEISKGTMSRLNRMRDLAMDINSLSHEDFRKKHRKTKQEMQDSLKNEEVEQIDELSNKTLDNYKEKAAREIRDADDNDDNRHYNKRMKGYTSALKAGQRNHQRIHGNLLDVKKTTKEEVELDEISSDMAHRYLKGKHERDYNTSADGKSSSLKKPQSFRKMNNDVKSSMRALRTIEKAKKLTKEDIDAVKSMHESYKNTFNAALEHYNIKSPSELGEDKRKEFFNHVDQKFKKGDN